MDIITAIATATSSLRMAADVGRAIVESDGTLERAELKLKLADMMGAVADARSQIATIQEATLEQQREIQRLKGAFESRDKVLRWHDAYYYINAEGKAAGRAHCAKCWDDAQLLRILAAHPGNYRVRLCRTCGSEYDLSAAQDLKETGPE
jgi:hypothetical protein